MGVKGAAVASSISYVIAAVTALSILGFREKLLSPMIVLSKKAWAIAAKPLLRIAIPVSLASIIAPLLSYFYTAVLARYVGDSAVAGFGVASRFEAFSLIPIMAVAGGMAQLIGQNFGAGLQDRVGEALRKAISFAVGYGVICAILFYMIAEMAVNAFSPHEDVRYFAVSYLVIVPFSYIGVNIFAVITSILNATGYPKIGLVLNLLRSFVVAMPLAYVMTNMWGVTGFLSSIVIVNILGGIAASLNIKRIHCASPNKSL